MIDSSPLVGAALGAVSGLAALAGILHFIMVKTRNAQASRVLDAEDMSARGEFVRKRLLTPNESHFFGVISKAVAGRYVLLTQVGLGALIDSSLPERHHAYMRERNRFVGKLLDYVIADPRTLEPVCVIELDDKTHDALKDFHRDNFLAQVGIPSIRYRSTNKPGPEKIFSDIVAIASNKSK